MKTRIFEKVTKRKGEAFFVLFLWAFISSVISLVVILSNYHNTGIFFSDINEPLFSLLGISISGIIISIFIDKETYWKELNQNE